MNLAIGLNDDVARTHPEVLAARAGDLARLRVRSVLELCVGPSLRVAEEAYGQFAITCVGNDIDPRWVKYHPNAKWLVGDALKVRYRPYDTLGGPCSRCESARRLAFTY